jgi:hypothetical protein
MVSSKTLLPLLALVPALTLLASPSATQAAYSHNPLAPSVETGSKKVKIKGTVTNVGTVAGGVSPTADYVTFTVPTGKVFTSLTLTSYTSTDDRGFVGLMAGNQWTTAPVFAPSQGLPGALAYSHFGTKGVCSDFYGALAPSGAENCATNPASQTDLFSQSLLGPVAGPLPSGNYTMWIQQTVANPITYEFEAEFQNAQAPGPLPILGAAAGFGVSRRLRQRIKSGAPQA